MAKLGSKFEWDTQEQVEQHASRIFWKKKKKKLYLKFGQKVYAF